MQLKSPAELCTPAQLYLGMSLLSTIGFSATSTEFLATMWHLFMNLVWTYFLNFLCDKGHSGISWFLILFPFLIILGIVFAFLHVMRNAKTATPTKKTGGSTTGATATATGAATATANKAGATQAESMSTYSPVW
jgi:hypothetical protein